MFQLERILDSTYSGKLWLCHEWVVEVNVEIPIRVVKAAWGSQRGVHRWQSVRARIQWLRIPRGAREQRLTRACTVYSRLYKGIVQSLELFLRHRGSLNGKNEIPNRSERVWNVQGEWEQLRRAPARTTGIGNVDGRAASSIACCENPPPARIRKDERERFLLSWKMGKNRVVILTRYKIRPEGLPTSRVTRPVSRRLRDNIPHSPKWKPKLQIGVRKQYTYLSTRYKFICEYTVQDNWKLASCLQQTLGRTHLG